MSSSRLSGFSLPRFHTSRGIDGDELVLERSGVGLWELLDRIDGAKGTHRRSKKGDARDEE
jgi:hypothetical protein